jgi:hypothetical protein
MSIHGSRRTGLASFMLEQQPRGDGNEEGSSPAAVMVFQGEDNGTVVERWLWSILRGGETFGTRCDKETKTGST